MMDINDNDIEKPIDPDLILAKIKQRAEELNEAEKHAAACEMYRLFLELIEQ